MVGSDNEKSHISDHRFCILDNALQIIIFQLKLKLIANLVFKKIFRRSLTAFTLTIDMKPWRMTAIVNVILIFITVVMPEFGSARYIVKPPLFIKKQKKAACLPLGKPCMESKNPCCTLIYQQSYMQLGSVPTTCFKFGKGVCQVNQSIDNFEEYGKLAKQLNNTNFQELKNKYWSSLQVAYRCPQKVIIELKSM